MRALARALAPALVLLAACTGPLIGGDGDTPESVAVQSSDVPSGLQKCSESGEINAYLDRVKSKNPSTYQQVNDLWQKEKKAGATLGWVQVYADSKAECTALISGQSPQSSQPPKLVLNYVIQFKDEQTATNDYSDEVFGLNPADIQRQGGSVSRGSETGLGQNSAVGSITLFGLPLGFAVWQRKAFFVAVIFVGMGDADVKKVYTGINGRIH